jgi:hypothetical protein
MPDRVKLTAAMRDALGWLYPDGSYHLWSGRDAGHPSIAALDALVKRGIARKRGGDGFPVHYAITITNDERRSLLASDAGDD